jgi:hypothetical protein
MKNKRMVICADHGLAIIYFLQSDLVSTILNAGVEIVFLTAGGLVDKLTNRYGRPGLVFEDLQLQKAGGYAESEMAEVQWWLNFFRRAGPSVRMNPETVNNYVRWVETEAVSRRKRIFPLIKMIVWSLRHSLLARKMLISLQSRFTPNLYSDLFTRYQPELVVASTPGWRLDRYILRDAASRGIKTAAIVLGWDNPSSHALPGAKVEWISCWSHPQKDELIQGSDWSPERINVGGIPSYDGYFQKKWLMSREDYFRLHNLDPERRLISYACSFVTYSPNIQNIEALVKLVTSEELKYPCQLLVRLHPNHFTKVKRWAREREQVRALVNKQPHVNLVEPVPLGEEFGHYSGEDMTEKSSMMAHSDIFVSVYSTMVVEASIHDRPIISVCIDAPDGWPGQYSLPLSDIGRWPTHSRFRKAGVGKIAYDESELKSAVNYYLENPTVDLEAQRRFVVQECTYLDGSAGRRTGEFLLSLL